MCNSADRSNPTKGLDLVFILDTETVSAFVAKKPHSSEQRTHLLYKEIMKSINHVCEHVSYTHGDRVSVFCSFFFMENIAYLFVAGK